ncbi:MAG TPA: RidA family protein [Nocardioides sp.]|nr:RidA family protein [Nocardioides sp.]
MSDTHVTEYVTVGALPAYDQVREARADAGLLDCVLTTVVVESLPDGSGFRIEPGAAPGRESTVVLPTVLPIDAHGEVVHAGDLVGQYAWCLDAADRALRALGLSLDAAVTTYDYTTPDTRDVYRRTHRARKERLGGAGVFPGAGGILMSRLHAPGVLVALDVTASRLPLTPVNPGWSRYDTLTYTPGVRAGSTLFMSGFAALDMDTQEALHPGDARAQAEATYAAIGEVLAAAGGGPEHVVSTLEYLCPEVDDAVVAGERKTAFGSPGPVASVAGCAGLLRPEFLLEVFPLAVLPRTVPA